MKFIFAVSGSPGHIDFGGHGYMNVARNLVKHGHEVIWLSFGGNVETLAKERFTVETFNQLTHLRFTPELVQGFMHNRDHDQVQQSLLCSDEFLKKLQQRKPDFVCLDRVLGLAPMALDQLNIPYAAVGTPGGHWIRMRGEGGAVIHDGPVEQYLYISNYICSCLGWKKSNIGSSWITSSFLNIIFLSHNFYSSLIKTERLASVNCFTQESSKREEIRIGLSFGNTGYKVDDMKELLRFLSSRGIAMDVFVGNRHVLKEELKDLYKSRIVNIHGWTDFSTATKKLSTFIFFGGVGTIWHCLNAYTPMVILSGGVGDQIVNGRAVEFHNIGEHLDQGFSVERDSEELLQRITDFSWIEECQNNIKYLRQADQFSDTLDSLRLRLEALAKQ